MLHAAEVGKMLHIYSLSQWLNFNQSSQTQSDVVYSAVRQKTELQMVT